MSLINDALKKAQRQRTEGNPTPAEITAPNAAPEELHRVARRAKPAGFRSQLMLIGGGAVATAILLGLVAMYYFRSGNQPAPVSATPTSVAVAPTPTVAPVAAQPAPAPVATAPAPAATAAASTSLPPAPSPVVASAPAPAPQPVIATPAPASSASPVTTASNQFALPPAPAAATASTPAASASASSDVIVIHPKPSTRMIGVIDHFRVGGIRMAGPDSKVLMNDKVYRLNDIVDYELNIRLTGIEAKALTFEDSHGAVHVRTF